MTQDFTCHLMGGYVILFSSESLRCHGNQQCILTSVIFFQVYSGLLPCQHYSVCCFLYFLSFDLNPQCLAEQVTSDEDNRASSIDHTIDIILDLFRLMVQNPFAEPSQISEAFLIDSKSRQYENASEQHNKAIVSKVNSMTNKVLFTFMQPFPAGFNFPQRARTLFLGTPDQQLNTYRVIYRNEKFVL